MLFRMRKQDRILVGLGGFLAYQIGKIRMLERNRQRTQPVGSLRMAFRCRMFEKDLVFVKAGGHETCPRRSVAHDMAHPPHFFKQQPLPSGRFGRKE
ncbi:hypothetical protein D3C73_768120 [compost metagenome]